MKNIFQFENNYRSELQVLLILLYASKVKYIAKKQSNQEQQSVQLADGLTYFLD